MGLLLHRRALQHFKLLGVLRFCCCLPSAHAVPLLLEIGTCQYPSHAAALLLCSMLWMSQYMLQPT